MKKLFILSTVFMPALLFAQSFHKFNFYVHGGYFSSLYSREILQKNIQSQSNDDRHKCIILNTGFQLRVSKNWRIGPSFTYDHFGSQDRSVEISTLGYLIKAERVWKETKRYYLYSGLSSGLKKIKLFENEILIQQKWKPAYQVCLAGAMVNIHRVYLDVNLGWGTEGFFNMGIRIPFGMMEK